MQKFKETEIKYLAGLLDADGCLSLKFNNNYLSIKLSLGLSESIDREGKYAKSLAVKAGNLYKRERNKNWAVHNVWEVYKRSELEQLLPRLIKHMVIKAKYWQEILDLYRVMKAVRVSKEEYKKILSNVQNLRKNTGPVKAKSHPTWAWVAGYIDGDGWLLNRTRKNHTEMHVGVVSHKDDKVGLELLQKAFGGVLKTDSKGYYRWIRNLGVKDKPFAIKFLKKIHSHSQLKKWKIEQLLANHSQRLNNSTSTEDAIV